MSGVAGTRWADVKPHGTLAAARRHYRHGTPLCGPCRQAEARERETRRSPELMAEHRERYAMLRAAGMARIPALRESRRSRVIHGLLF